MDLHSRPDAHSFSGCAVLRMCVYSIVLYSSVALSVFSGAFCAQMKVAATGRLHRRRLDSSADGTGGGHSATDTIRLAPAVCSNIYYIPRHNHVHTIIIHNPSRDARCVHWFLHCSVLFSIQCIVQYISDSE